MLCSSVWFKSVAGFALLFGLAGVGASAEDGSAAWLRYAPIPSPGMYESLPSRIFVYGDSATDHAAGVELQRGLTSLLGRPFTLQEEKSRPETPSSNAIVVQSFEWKPRPRDIFVDPINSEGYSISWDEQHSLLSIGGVIPQGDLYAAFHLLEEIASEQPIPKSF